MIIRLSMVIPATIMGIDSHFEIWKRGTLSKALKASESESYSFPSFPQVIVI